MVPGEQPQRPVVRACVLAADAEQRQVAAAQHRGVEGARPQVDEGADLDERPAVANEVERGQEGVRVARRVDRDVGLEAGGVAGRRRLVRTQLERELAAPGDRSIATTRPAPRSAAFATWTRPSGPTPTTATVSPERKPPGGGSRAARSIEFVTLMSSVSTATSVGSPSGTRNTGVPGRT